MIFLILATYVIAVRGDVTKDDIFIDGVRYQTETLITNATLYWLYALAVDYSFNDLYFIDNERLAILNLNTGKHKYIEGEIDVLCVTVDQETHDVYLGACDGIYKYQPSTGVLELIGAEGVIIRNVYFKRVLYYVEYYSGRVFTFNNGESRILDNMQYDVDGLVIDNEDVMFFSNTTQLYSLQNDSKYASLYYDEYYVFSIALDRNGKVYFSDFAIYEVVQYNATYRNLVTIDGLRGLTFDKDNNFIYCDWYNIYRLKPIVEGSTRNLDVMDENRSSR